MTITLHGIHRGAAWPRAIPHFPISGTAHLETFLLETRSAHTRPNNRIQNVVDYYSTIVEKKKKPKLKKGQIFSKFPKSVWKIVAICVSQMLTRFRSGVHTRREVSVLERGRFGEGRWGWLPGFSVRARSPCRKHGHSVFRHFSDGARLCPPLSPLNLLISTKFNMF